MTEWPAGNTENLNQDLSPLLKAVMSSISQEVSTQESDLVAAPCWMAGELCLGFSQFFQKIPAGTMPGTVIMGEEIDWISGKFMELLFDTIKLLQPDTTRENWIIKKPFDQYESIYTGELAVNHPGVIANRARDKVYQIIDGLGINTGQSGYFLMQASGWMIANDPNKSRHPEMTGTAFYWFMKGLTTMPG